MVTGSVDSFVSKDLYLARTVIISDDIVDNYFDDIKKKLIALIAKQMVKVKSLLTYL